MTIDMDHMSHLEAVAQGDVAALREKEATYQGSWKRRGGVGAFMMLARKWDRIESILSRDDGPFNAYDVFDRIHKDPSGSDGTVLAEVRDLRRYLLLVEAEMMARGAVPPPEAVDDRHVEPTRPGTPEDGGQHANLAPWVRTEPFEPRAMFNMLYQQRGRGCHPLEPAVSADEMGGLLLMKSAYVGAATVLYDRLAAPWWVLRISEAPAAARDFWPTLRTELNHKEYTDSPEWQHALYSWIDAETKYRIRPEYVAWCES